MKYGYKSLKVLTLKASIGLEKPHFKATIEVRDNRVA